MTKTKFTLSYQSEEICMLSSWEKRGIPNLSWNTLQQIIGTSCDYMSILGGGGVLVHSHIYRKLMASITYKWHMVSWSSQDILLSTSGSFILWNLWNIISIVSDTYNISEYILLTINFFYIINRLNISNDFPGFFHYLPF